MATGSAPMQVIPCEYVFENKDMNVHSDNY